MKIYELLDDLKDWLETEARNHDGNRWRQANFLENPYRAVLDKIEDLESIHE